MNKKNKRKAGDELEGPAASRRRLSDEAKAILLQIPEDMQVVILQHEGLRTIMRFAQVHRDTHPAVGRMVQFLFIRDIRGPVLGEFQRLTKEYGPDYEVSATPEVQRILDGEVVTSAFEDSTARYRDLVRELASAMVDELANVQKLFIENDAIEFGFGHTVRVVVGGDILHILMNVWHPDYDEEEPNLRIWLATGYFHAKETKLALERAQQGLDELPLPLELTDRSVRAVFFNFFMDLLCNVTPQVVVRFPKFRDEDDDTRVYYPGSRLGLETFGIVELNEVDAGETDLYQDSVSDSDSSSFSD